MRTVEGREIALREAIRATVAHNMGAVETTAAWRVYRTMSAALASGDAVVVLQANRRNHPDLPKVPQAIKLAKTEEGRKMIEVAIHGDSDIVRTYTLPPGTPKDRVQLLRKAFDATLTDPEFVAATRALLGK